MKRDFLFKKIVIQQVKFRISKFVKKDTTSTLFSVVRGKNPLSLIVKTMVVTQVFGIIKVRKNKSDFIEVSSTTDDNVLDLNERFNIIFKKLNQPYTLNDTSSINNVSFSRSIVSISLNITDIISVVKKAKIENIYDFFNWPIKFNGLIRLSIDDYIIISLFKNGI